MKQDYYDTLIGKDVDTIDGLATIIDYCMYPHIVGEDIESEIIQYEITLIIKFLQTEEVKEVHESDVLIMNFDIFDIEI